MNFNTSPIAFFPSRAAQIWRAWFAQRKISVICGNDLLPFYIIDNGNAPTGGELYDPNTDTKVDDIDFAGHLLDHDITVDGQSAHIWIYQGEMAGVFGRTNPGYYYLKIGNWYSDVFRIGALSSEYTEINWQFYDDIITADGTPISKHIKYRQIFETPLWHPEYNIEEEGKTNNGIFYAMQQTTKKTSGFNAIVNESQIDCLNLTRMADNITVKACLNGTVKTMQTNQFEISSKWESDDVASIECKFDLFAIIRKYQQSNVEPEPLPIPVPPPPPSNYIIKGKATGTTVHLKINGTDTALPVTNGEFYYSYDTPLQNIATYNYTENYDYPLPNKRLAGVENITELDCSESCGFASAALVSFYGMENCTKADFTNCTFASVENANGFLENAKSLTNVLLPDATFANVKMCITMFASCESIKNISIPNAQITNIQGPIDGHAFVSNNNLFEHCKLLETVSMPLCTFEHCTTTFNMFINCEKLNTITMTAATFADATGFTAMFAYAHYTGGTFNFGNVFPACTAKPVYLDLMFQGAKIESINLSAVDTSATTSMYSTFYKSNLHTLTMNASQFANVNRYELCFSECDIDATTNTLLSTIDFAAATNTKQMFMNAGRYQTAGNIDLTAATFANVTNAESMFKGCGFVEINMPTATFEKVTNANTMFYDCTATTAIDMTSATFDVVTSASSFLLSCNALQTLTVPDSSTWPLNFSLAQSASLNISAFVNISKWVKDYSGGTAHALTFNASAVNNWRTSHFGQYSTASQRLQNKNWTF